MAQSRTAESKKSDDLKKRILCGPYPRIPGKTVYILGAGFSAAAGLPVMKGFLSKGLLLMKTKVSPDWKSQVGPILELMDRFQPLFSNGASDEPSLEELFCVVDLFGSRKDRETLCQFVREVFGAAWDRHLNDLKSVKGHNKSSDNVPTVGQVYFQNRARTGIAGQIVNTNRSEVCAYSAFLSQILSSRSTPPPELKGHVFSHSAIVSLNYDLLIEEKLRKFNEYPDGTSYKRPHAAIYYGAGVIADCTACQEFAKIHSIATSSSSDGPFCLPIIKPHGSLNWRESELDSASRKSFHICQTCDPDFGGEHTAGKCSENCLIYPTWQRDPIGNTVFDKLLTEARIHLRLASKIVIIGYSLPDTDTYLKYILADAMRTPEVPEIQICNRGDASYWGARAKSIFGPRLSDAKLKIWDGFVNYVSSNKDPYALDPFV